MTDFTLDYFVAELRCPRCGFVSRADDSTGMQTYIRTEPQLAWLKVGDPLEIDLSAVNGRGYLIVQPPEDPVRILQSWSCPSSGSINWAEVVVRDGRIESITAVPLDQSTLDRLHLLDAEAKGLAAALSDREFKDVSNNEVITLLRQRLPVKSGY